MDLKDLIEDFQYLLGRDLSLFEFRMIKRSYIIGLANGVNLMNDESSIINIIKDDLVGDDN